jgi:transposase-like protein
MITKLVRKQDEIRYSESFKLTVVGEVEESGLAFNAVARKYGIKGTATVQRWVRKYGNGTRGRIIRVEKPEEIDQKQQLQERVRVLEQTVGSLHVDLALERAYTQIACQQAGIDDVAAFKKKAAGRRDIKP